MKKQYIVGPAYTGTVRITRYVDGRCIDYEVINEYDIPRRALDLENCGYERAEDVERALADMKAAKKAYKEAVKRYKYAKSRGLLTYNLQTLRFIPDWSQQKSRCHFCGETRSVKYMMDIVDPVVSSEPTSVCVCNACALKYRVYGIEHDEV